jgi:EmrB/QacA subfamily drug resistance transporter
LFYLYASFFISVMNVTSVKILLPDIMHGLNVELNWLTWVVNAYTLPLAVFIPIAGKIGDLYGARRFFIYGLLGLAVGSLMCGAAFSLPWLIAGRIVQALGAALLAPNALSILLTGVAESRRGRLLGIWGGVGSAGALFGPVISGLLVDSLTWRGSFLLIAGLTVTIYLAARISLSAASSAEPDRQREKSPFDLTGALILISSTSILLMGITLLPDWGWENRWILSSLIVFVSLQALFYRAERRAADPILNLSLLNRPGFTLGSVVGFLEQFVMTGTLFVLPIFFSTVQNHGAMVTAFLLTPAAAAGVFFAPLGGRASDHFGPGPPIVIGMIMRAVSFVMLSQISLNTPYLPIAAALALSGMGFGLTSAPALTAVIAGNGNGHYGIASGIQNMIRFTGASIGTAIGGIMLYALTPATLTGITGAIPGFKEVFLMCAAVCMPGVAAGVWLWVKAGRSGNLS